MVLDLDETLIRTLPEAEWPAHVQHDLRLTFGDPTGQKSVLLSA